MKFGKRLAQEMISCWRDDYVNYKLLKQFVTSSELHGDAFAEALMKIIYEEIGRADALFQVLFKVLEDGVAELLALSPRQLVDPPPRRGPFYRRHRRVVRRPSTTPSTSAGGSPQTTSSQQSQSKQNFNGGEAGGYGSTDFTAAAGGTLEEEDDALLNSPVLNSLALPIPPSADEATLGGMRMASVLTEDIDDDSQLLLQASCLGRMLRKVQRIFLRIIGDFHVRVVASNTPEALFLEWTSNARKLQHFAELNVEAIRKTLKKLRKHRKDEPDFETDLEYALSHSRLCSEQPALKQLIEVVHLDFEHKFGEPFDRYASLSLAEHWIVHWRYVFLAVLLFLSVLHFPFLHDSQPAHHCVALFMLVMVLWLTEAIPFFCTAMLIPLVAVPLGIVSDPSTGETASPSVASHLLLGKVFTSVQILVMGGLTIGKALARTNLEMYAVSALHRHTGHKPALYLLALMLASCVLCAFVSNVAAPLLTLSVLRHTLWEFNQETTAPHGVLLGLAFACNLGGMLSPIASPQNAVAMTVLSFHEVTFLQWVMVALPVVMTALVVAWLVILVIWKPFADVRYIPLQVVDMVSARKVSRLDRLIVIVVSLVTIFLWMLPNNFIFGDTGIVALIPIVTFFGMGILSKDDFNTLSWHLMFLLAGGNMLGLCAHDSKMLDVVAGSMKDTLSTTMPYTSLVIITIGVAIVTTFVSHTVAAMILLPVIAKIGFLMPQEAQPGWLAVSPQSLVIIAALMCSGAMAFPISSFPNVNSLLAEDAHGKPYLRAKDFLLSGTIITVFFTISLVTWMVPYTYFLLRD